MRWGEGGKEGEGEERRKGKRRRRRRLEKGEDQRPSLRADDIILYTEIPTE